MTSARNVRLRLWSIGLCLVVLGLAASVAIAQVAPPPVPPVPGAAKPTTPTPPTPAPPPTPPTTRPATPGTQPATPATPADPATPAAPPAKKPPVRVEETLQTRDGVSLVVDYLGSTKGKKAVPVILLHGFQGSRKDYKELALFLQAQGHAVVVPDLRGHGASTKMVNGGAVNTSNVNYEAMILQDLETVKGFLMAKNNNGELNIENLCVVGADMGATVAALWAAWDWHWPILTTGKQGQDVKALVLLSPKLTHRTLRITDALKSPAVQKNLSILIVVGGQTPAAVHEASSIHKMWLRYHPEPPEDRRREDKDLFLQPVGSLLQGTKLVSVKGLNVDKLIDQFIEARIVAKAYPWKNRKAE
jgi:pimeloyl-ACP methyl ester carboxylesterase